MEADSSMETGHASQDDQKKKRRVLKRVLKKDKIKAKGFKQKGKLNTSLTSLSKSFNRSVTSLVIKQTLQSNNRQLAMTLERTRQELRIANSRELELRGEIVDLQTQVSTYKHMAGLKPEQIENEVKYRMEKYISDLKTHLGKMGQQLFEASASLGDAMDLCMTVSRRSTSCRSSAVSVMSDDEEDSHHAVRPAMLQTEVLTSDILPRNIPQRVACLDMSVIAEQSMLQEDIPADQDDLPTNMDLQEELIEEENFPQNMVSESDEENVVHETENVVEKNQKNDNKSDNKSTESKAGSEKVSKNTDNKKENEKVERVESEKSKPGKEKPIMEGESVNKKAMPIDDIKSTKSKTETCSSINGVKTDQKNKSEEKDLKSDISDQALRENVCNMQNKQDKEKAHTVKIDEKKAENKRSKQRRETYVLPENAAQQENCIATKKVEHKQNSRRGTFVVKETKSDDTETESEENDAISLRENNQSEASNHVSKTRRETFVLPSKSHDQLTSKNDLKNPTKSKSDGFLTMDDERRKTFLVPAPKERNVPKSAPQTDAVNTFDDPEVTEYFNCDMDFTEVIDNSNKIILESSNPSGKNSNKMNSKDQDKDGKSNSQKSNGNNKASMENKTENKGLDNEKKKDNQAAVEFRVPKPGKIIFAASRKKFDGKREPVPTKLPQRSRSKPKVKLSKTNEKDESIKSMFDFHEKTPTVLKQQSSVYDLSMNESVHGQKESFSSFRDKMHNAEQTKLQEEPGKDKEKVSNDNGEIIYHLPLKGCSPDIPKPSGRSQSRGRSRGKSSVVMEDDKKTSTSRSKSRGRSEAESTEDEKSSVSRARSRSRGRSRGKRMVVVDDDEIVDLDNDAKPSTTRSKSRGRPKQESVEEDESCAARGRSRSKKRVEEVATTRRSRSSKRNEAEAVELSPSKRQGDDDDVDKVLQRRSRSRRRHMTEDEECTHKKESVDNGEGSKEELDNMQTKVKESEISKKPDTHSKRSKSKGRPRKLSTKDILSEEEEKELSELEPNREADEQLNNQKPTRSKSRRRQKSEINYCESDTELEDKDNRKQDEMKKKKARSKSVSSKTDTEVGSHLENTEPEKEMEVDNEIKQPKDNLLESAGDQIISNKEDVNIDKHKDRLQTDKEEMVRNKSVGRSRSKSGKISKTISSDDDDDFQLQKKSTKKPKRKSNSELDPLDQLFKNAKKKSICEVFVTSDTTSDEFSAPVPDESFHVICETPMKPKDSSETQTKIDNDNKNPKQTKELSDTESTNLEGGKLDMDLKCVTKRARSKKHSVKKSDDFNLSEDVEKPHVVEDKDKSVISENLDNNISGKRLHSTLISNSEEEKKNKKFKNENKENTGSSLNSLKKRLASLGTSLKPQAVVSEAVSGSEEVPEIKDNEKERMSQGKGVFTPSSENVNGVSKSRRAAANVCYKEVPLRTKLRREDVLAGKKLVW